MYKEKVTGLFDTPEEAADHIAQEVDLGFINQHMEMYLDVY